jgi:hypothetical protein
MFDYVTDERDKPLFYYRSGVALNNCYRANAHPNDKRSSAVKDKSRGRMIGLEEAGWVGYSLRDSWLMYAMVLDYHNTLNQ